jgi:hypothetical protein
MKSALVQGFKAFVSQARANRIEHARNICTKAGYSVEEPKPQQQVVVEVVPAK